MRAEYMKTIAALGAFYDKPLSAQQITMYAEHLMVLSPEELSFAIKKYQSDPENKFYPLPAILVSMVKPKENSELDIGREVAGRIIQAVSKHGYTNPNQAKEFIGELGWKVVERQGGWVTLCSEMNDQTKGIMQAQMRDLAISLLRMSMNGTLDQPINLPANRGATGMATLGDVTKKLVDLQAGLHKD